MFWTGSREKEQDKLRKKRMTALRLLERKQSVRRVSSYQPLTLLPRNHRCVARQNIFRLEYSVLTTSDWTVAPHVVGVRFMPWQSKASFSIWKPQGPALLCLRLTITESTTISGVNYLIDFVACHGPPSLLPSRQGFSAWGG